ncbi:MAG: PAS domain S-box protein [Phenylobacterium sp.]|uniref:PAS domain S-box protein n=1 Tax=Phenylobacterium sp. TaxID=1871053 RepID=UPI0025D64CB2|nr:PAS domain S-box protein [Phenylobacterium sp.]MBI1200410.1 PAS domain S-box protein [Phenylobacterium sp.]
MDKHHVLIVGAPAFASTLLARLPAPGRDGGGAPAHAQTVAEAEKALADASADVVIAQAELPDAEPRLAFRRLKAAAGDRPVVIVLDRPDDALRGAALGAGAEEVVEGDELFSEIFARSLFHLVERRRLVQQHAQLEKVLDTTPDAILVVNGEGVVRYVNEAALDLFDRRRGDFVDERLGFSVKDGDAVEITTLRRGAEHVCEMRVVQIEWRGEEACLAALRDVTERRRMEDALRASEQRLRLSETHFASAQRIAEVGSYVKDLQTGLLTGTPQFYRIFGLAPVGPETWNRYWTQAVSDETRERIDANSDAARRGRRPPPLEFEFVRDDGARRVALHDADVVFDDGAPTALLGVIRDVTDVKIAEARSRTLNRELEARVHARTAQLEAANHELEAFSYTVSHDLRSPLRAIDGFSRILQRDHGDQLSDDAHHCVSVVRASARRMGQLIDDLLALSQIGSQTLRTTQIDMAALARDVVGELRPQEPETKVEITIGPLPPANGDAALVRLILQNLVENAFKYSRSKPVARIEVGAVTGKSNPPVYFVRDNGVGFNMRFANKLFGIFQRLHPPGEFQGSGVGLAIAQRAVHRHGGRIWGEGKVGRGARFFFTLAPDSAGGPSSATSMMSTREATP